MNAATRPFAAAGVALMSAGFIAATPAIAPTTSALPQVHIPDLALQASIFDIFTFPAYQQAILNEVEFVAIRATGLFRCCGRVFADPRSHAGPGAAQAAAAHDRARAGTGARQLGPPLTSSTCPFSVQ